MNAKTQATVERLREWRSRLLLEESRYFNLADGTTGTLHSMYRCHGFDAKQNAALLAEAIEAIEEASS